MVSDMKYFFTLQWKQVFIIDSKSNFSEQYRLEHFYPVYGKIRIPIIAQL